jgi:DNA-directed RNA polymerase specialized sigma24 family protein
MPDEKTLTYFFSSPPPYFAGESAAPSKGESGSPLLGAADSPHLLIKQKHHRFPFSLSAKPWYKEISVRACLGRRLVMSEGASFHDLMRRVQAGDPQAALELVRNYEWAVRLQVRVRLTEPDLRRLLDSMDVVQLVWASFFPRAATGKFELDDPKKLLNLLITLAHNKLLDQAKHLRRKRRGAGQVVGGIPAQAEPIDPRPGPEQAADERDFLDAVNKRLSAQERLLWDQRLQGRSWVEIAADLGGDADVLRIQFNRALERVARQLRPPEKTP